MNRGVVPLIFKTYDSAVQGADALLARSVMNSPTASSVALKPASPLWLTQTRMAKSRRGATQTLAKFMVLSPP